MRDALEAWRPTPLELIWASPREVLNVVQADAVGCHVITVTHDLLAKLPRSGKDLDEFSLDTVQMFHETPRPRGNFSNRATLGRARLRRVLSAGAGPRERPGSDSGSGRQCSRRTRATGCRRRRVRV